MLSTHLLDVEPKEVDKSDAASEDPISLSPNAGMQNQIRNLAGFWAYPPVL